jgi:hypothetical protein
MVLSSVLAVAAPPNVSATERSAERLRAVSDQGVFVIYDAAVPANDPRETAGYVAYWNDYASGVLHIYDGLMFTTGDVGQAAIDLERDLDINVATLTKARPSLGRAVELAEGAGSRAFWVPATYEGIVVVMGFDVTDELLAEFGFGRGPTAEPSIICVPLPPPEERAHLVPPDRGSARDVIVRGVASAGCGGGGNPPGGGGDPSGCVCCAAVAVAGVAETPCCQECCGNRCDDGDPCTEDDMCDGGCRGTPKDCDDGDPCTHDRCFGGACVNEPWCADGTCCPTAGGFFCCPQADAVCCHNPDHCCGSDDECCGAGCCGPGDTCCEDQCGPKGACCFFDTGACTERTSACCAEEGGAYLGAGTACTPGDLCRPVCENCHSVTGTFAECEHAMTGPCDPTHCIRNTIDTVSCDYYWYRLGDSECNTSLLSSGTYMIQERVPLTNMSCAPTDPGGFHVWTTLYAGCGGQCVGENQNVRCDVPACVGEAEFPPEPRGPATVCGCPP